MPTPPRLPTQLPEKQDDIIRTILFRIVCVILGLIGLVILGGILFAILAAFGSV
jgi:hypothetical protein